MAPVKHGDTVLRCVIVMKIVLLVLLNQCECVHRYSRHDLFHILATSNCEYKPIFLHISDDFIIDNQNKNNSTWLSTNTSTDHRRQIRKRGKRSGVLVRFRRRAHRPPLPAIVLSNVRSLNNKTDELFHLMSFKREFKEASILCLTETWLKRDKPDSAVTPPGFLVYRTDRSLELAEKEEGGGVCFMVNTRWCTDTTVFSRSCSPLLEHLTINCRPFYSPREFSSVVLVAVYIPPEVNATAAINELTTHVQAAEAAFPNSIVIVTGDFNHTNLRETMPRYKQHVDCPTREKNTLDHCYTTIKNAYRATPRAPLGDSDHVMVMLTPTYRQKLKAVKPITKTVRRWTQDSIETLQGCLESTDWDVFKAACPSLDEYTDTVTSYISFCEDVCISTKTVRIYGNNKPWFSKSVKTKLDAKNAAFKSGDRVQFKQAKAEVRREIRRAKAVYREKVESHFASSNPRDVWQGLQQITNYKERAVVSDDSDLSLSDKLNLFYSRFEEMNPAPGYRPPLPDDISLLTPPFSIQETEVKSLFKKQNTRKAAGPDNVSTSTLRHCADQLAPVFTDIFNASLQQHAVPRCFKSSIIIPVPKKTKVTQLNDYRPVALTSVIMKVLERIVLRYLKASTDHLRDPFQFAYQANRSVDDAVALGVHHILQHLEAFRTYARVLFIDFSSAFNTIIPHKLFDKLSAMNVHPLICHWLLDFLLNRPQVVKLRDICSGSQTLNTGTPQGCVLSPLLFTLFTNDYTPSNPSVIAIKFSDDTTIEGLISNSDESDYREEVERLAGWCSDNNLLLNTSKTKEMIIDFRKNKVPLTPLEINGEPIEQVDSFKFLGTVISSDLTWTNNITSIVKKCQQRLHFLRQLKKFKMNQAILTQFYRAVIESILSFSITVWYGSANEKDKDRLERIVRNAAKITGCDLPSIASLYRSRMIRKSKKIIRDKSHPASHLFELLPSGRRYRALKTRTCRFRNSFFPEAMLIMSDV